MRVDGSALLPMPLFADRGFSAGIVTQAAFQGSLNAFTLPFIIYLRMGAFLARVFGAMFQGATNTILAGLEPLRAVFDRVRLAVSNALEFLFLP